MGCCGDETRSEATGRIVKAHVRAATDKIGLTRPPVEFVPRYDKCRVCPHRTWLSRYERARWLWSNKGEIVVNPHKIGEQTSELPVNLEQEKGHQLYCRRCRCKCILKARLPDGECCLDLWDQ